MRSRSVGLCSGYTYPGIVGWEGQWDSVRIFLSRDSGMGRRVGLSEIQCNGISCYPGTVRWNGQWDPVQWDMDIPTVLGTVIRTL